MSRTELIIQLFKCLVGIAAVAFAMRIVQLLQVIAQHQCLK